MKVITVRDTGTEVWAAVTISDENWQKLAEGGKVLQDLIKFYNYKEKNAKAREEFHRLQTL